MSILVVELDAYSLVWVFIYVTKMLVQFAKTWTWLLDYARVTQAKQNIEGTSKKTTTTEFVIVDMI